MVHSCFLAGEANDKLNHLTIHQQFHHKSHHKIENAEPQHLERDTNVAVVVEPTDHLHTQTTRNVNSIRKIIPYCRRVVLLTVQWHSSPRVSRVL